jgi:hypothetical protein
MIIAQLQSISLDFHSGDSGAQPLYARPLAFFDNSAHIKSLDRIKGAAISLKRLARSGVGAE